MTANGGPLSLMCTRMYFSYSQVMVFDRSENHLACDWTQTHHDQGFARRDTVASFGTLLEFGHGALNVFAGAYQQNSSHERVIAIPFHVVSGQVCIEGPEEGPRTRALECTRGHYRLTVAQAVLQDNEQDMVFEERIDVFLERLDKPASKSEIIAADAQLNPPPVLLEYADPIEL